MSKQPPEDTSQPALFEFETVPRPRRRRRSSDDDEIIIGWSPDITEFVECAIPQGLLSSKLSIETKGIASMLGVFADEHGCMNPAPSHVQIAGMYLDGHPAEVVQRLNEMIAGGWLYYIGPQHYQWGMGDPPENPRLIPPSAVAEDLAKVPMRKTISRAELERRADEAGRGPTPPY